MSNRGQSKRHSWLEVYSNIAIGWIINFLMNFIMFPIFLGVQISLSANLVMGTLYTVIAIVRGYYLRRLWNWIHVNEIDLLAWVPRIQKIWSA